MPTSRFEQRKTNVLDQLKWLADHDYWYYTDENSSGRMAVYKADINRLLDLVDQFWSYSHWNGRPKAILDTDELQIKLEAIWEMDDEYKGWESTTVFSMQLLEIESAIIEPVTKWVQRVG